MGLSDDGQSVSSSGQFQHPCNPYSVDGDNDVGEPAHVATVLHLCCDELFPRSCSRDCSAKGAVIAGVPMNSEDHGDLMDEHAWAVMERAMGNEVTDCIVLTPPTRSFQTSPTIGLPAFRGCEGPAVAGCAGLPKDLKAIVKLEDLLWLKVATTLGQLHRS